MNSLARRPAAVLLLPLPLLLLGLTACPSAKKEPATAAARAPMAPGALTSSPGASYQTYRGQLPGRADSVTLHLTTTSFSAEAETITGFGSYYGADGEVHRLRQLRSQPDSLLLNEYEPTGRDANGLERDTCWRLARQPDGRLTGTRGGQRLRLRPAAAGLRLTVRTFADSIAAYPGRAHSPHGHVELQVLVPEAGGPVSEATAQVLAANLLRRQRGDTVVNRAVGAPDPYWQQFRQQFVEEYRAGVADLAPDPAGPANPAAADSLATPDYALRFVDQQRASVLCQPGDLLSVAFFGYSYSGGAHGSYGTHVSSFDLRSGRALAFEDIFRPAARTRLLPLLERAARRALGLAPGARLDTALFDNHIKLTRNICLTPGGALFVYVPYEIASYAQGEIEVFVPLAELRPLLRAGLPLPDGSAL